MSAISYKPFIEFAIISNTASSNNIDNQWNATHIKRKLPSHLKRIFALDIMWLNPLQRRVKGNQQYTQC